MGTVTKWGTQMSGAALQRTRVAANYQAYVVLLGDQVLSKLMAYVQGFGYVECTPEEALQYKLNAYPAYFMLVGRLDVEPNGAFHSGAVTMEYIQMGSQAYSNLIQMRQMNPTANVVCVVGQANKKGQVSMNYMPAMLQLPPEAQQRVEAFMAKPEMLLSAFQMLDANTGRSVKQYQDWLQSKQGMPVGAVPTGGVQAPYPPMSQVVQGPVPPTSAAQVYVPGLGYPQSSGGYGSQPMPPTPAAAPQPQVPSQPQVPPQPQGQTVSSAPTAPAQPQVQSQPQPQVQAPSMPPQVQQFMESVEDPFSAGGGFDAPAFPDGDAF